jgi:methylated-DNA-[protein]-cysteine S-methyltransferase
VVERLEYTADGWGVGELWLADGSLVHHELPAPVREAKLSSPRGESKSPSGTLASVGGGAGADSVPKLPQRFRAYFEGARAGFDDVSLDLAWCTPFQRAVAVALRSVPYGEVVTYGELAALAGYPNAQRAAGSFCAHNRFPLVLPCHRVVSAGGLGSYGSLGSDYKRRLLRLEGVPL